MYFGTGDLVFKGNANGGQDPQGSVCTMLIADTIYFNGNTGYSAGQACPPDFIPEPGIADQTVRLVD